MGWISLACGALLVAVAGGVLALQATTPDVLVRARAVLFTEYVTPTGFDVDPATLDAAGFRVDDVETQRQFRRGLDSLPGWRERLAAFERIEDPVARAQTIVATISTYGERRRECGTEPRLIDRLTRPGCCSDHSEAFIALARVVGLSVREVHSDAHTVSEVWDTRSRHWVMIDPMFGLFARDATGRRLSLTELRAARLEGQPVQLESFHPGPFGPAVAEALHNVYDAPTPFTHVRFTFGTNVLAEESLRQRLSFAPKVVARLTGYALGITPTYRTLVDSADRASVGRFTAERDGAWALLIIAGFGAALWPASVATDLFRRRTVARAAGRSARMAMATAGPAAERLMREPRAGRRYRAGSKRS